MNEHESLFDLLDDEMPASSPMRETLGQASMLREAGRWHLGSGRYYQVINTDVPVKSQPNGPNGRRLHRMEPLTDVWHKEFAGWFPRLRAQRYAVKMKPVIPSYRLAVERRGRLHYEVVAYQNILLQTQPDSREVRGVVQRLMEQVKRW